MEIQMMGWASVICDSVTQWWSQMLSFFSLFCFPSQSRCITKQILCNLNKLSVLSLLLIFFDFLFGRLAYNLIVCMTQKKYFVGEIPKCHSSLH